MRAYKCDRCKILYEEYEGISLWRRGYNAIFFSKVIGQDRYYSSGVYELCPSCMQKVVNYITRTDRKEKDDNDS